MSLRAYSRPGRLTVRLEFRLTWTRLGTAVMLFSMYVLGNGWNQDFSFDGRRRFRTVKSRYPLWPNAQATREKAE